MTRSDLIARRQTNWRDFWYHDGLRARHQRQWRRYVGVGAVSLFGEPIQEEIIKAFERHVEQCSGLGERMMHDVVARYYRIHPGRRLVREFPNR